MRYNNVVPYWFLCLTDLITMQNAFETCLYSQLTCFIIEELSEQDISLFSLLLVKHRIILFPSLNQTHLNMVELKPSFHS